VGFGTVTRERSTLIPALIVLLGIGSVSWFAYDGLWRSQPPSSLAYRAGNRAFDDGAYERALQEYQIALQHTPNDEPARRGKALTLMQLGRHAEALHEFDTLLANAPQAPGPLYANRGILHDRLGHYPAAIADYEAALRTDPALAAGPGWLTRFLRLQADPPSTIAARASYLRSELAKPPAQRLLRLPEADAKQRPYQP